MLIFFVVAALVTLSWLWSRSARYLEAIASLATPPPGGLEEYPEQSMWNYSNCYAFALDAPQWGWLNVGGLRQYLESVCAGITTEEWDGTTAHARRLVAADGLVPAELGTVPQGAWLVSLWVSTRQGDFHFERLGTASEPDRWVEKLGAHAAAPTRRRRAALARLPKRGYTFAGYWWVSPQCPARVAVRHATGDATDAELGAALADARANEWRFSHLR